MSNLGVNREKYGVETQSPRLYRDGEETPILISLTNECLVEKETTKMYRKSCTHTCSYPQCSQGTGSGGRKG